MKATLKLLEELVETLVKYNCRLRIDKCEILKSILAYLGFDIGDGWWAPSSAKLGPLSRIHLDENSTPTEINSFLGAVKFHKRHMPRFAWNSGHISDCIKKKNPRKWESKECTKALEELKEKMCPIHTLGVPLPNESFIFVTDSCNYGCGGSLYQLQLVEESKRRQINNVAQRDIFRLEKSNGKFFDELQ